MTMELKLDTDGEVQPGEAADVESKPMLPFRLLELRFDHELLPYVAVDGISVGDVSQMTDGGVPAVVFLGAPADLFDRCEPISADNVLRVRLRNIGKKSRQLGIIVRGYEIC